jgi:hypothetical protein
MVNGKAAASQRTVIAVATFKKHQLTIDHSQLDINFKTLNF